MNLEDLPDTQKRLVQDLYDADAPQDMLLLAANGEYHDYISRFPAPKITLVAHAEEAGLEGIAANAKRGKYDDSHKELDEVNGL